MIMKTNIQSMIKGVLMTVLSVFILSSCDDFLNQEPLSAVSPEKYLQTPSQLQAYVDAYYVSGDYTGDGSIPSASGSGGQSPYHDDDATDNQQGTNNRYIKDSWTVPQSGGMWSFTRIYALNYFIQTVQPRVDEGTLSGTDALQYLGEGYFLRALEYYYRLRKLGDFPIVKETLADDQEILTEASKRSPRNEVARFILEDLDKAISMMNNSVAKTRISKNAALLLKSRVALFEGTWEKYHAGTPFVPGTSGWPGAAKNPGYSYNNATEVDFFLTQAMDAASQLAESLPLTANNKVVNKAGMTSSNQYYDMFASHDPTAMGEVIMCRLYKDALSQHYFNHYLYHGGQTGYTEQFEKAFLMENGLPWYASDSGYAGDDLINDTKIDRDWRWRLFMLGPGDVKAIKNTTVYEYFPEAPQVYASDNKIATSTGYIQGKGHSMDYNDQVLGKDLTAFVVFRAAEAYLNYIEASYLKNGNIDAKAEKYWKALRTRAGVDPDFTKTIAATDMTKEVETDWGAYSAGKVVDATLYNIRRERRCEFIGEGFRLDDLMRWRALDQLNGFQLKGAHIFSEKMLPLFGNLLKYDQANDANNNVSSPGDSEWLLPNRKTKSNQYYNGFFFYPAHYLYPIAVQHFLITSPDGATPSESTIYQNPGWSTVAGKPCD
jgi:hypothetical protein